MLRAISVIPQNSPKRNPVPPARFLQLHSGRQRAERCCSQLPLIPLLALKCIIMQMWILILNLRRGVGFLFFFQTKRSHMWSSLLLYFVTWIVTMHSAKGGRGQQGEGSSFASLFYGFCVHGTPRPGRDGEWEPEAVRSIPWAAETSESSCGRQQAWGPHRSWGPAVPIHQCIWLQESPS